MEDPDPQVKEADDLARSDAERMDVESGKSNALDEDATNDEAEAPVSGSDRRHRRRPRARRPGLGRPPQRRIVVAFVLAAVIIGCGIASGVLVGRLHAYQVDADMRKAALEAAETVVLKLTSIKATSAGKSMDEINQLSTGTFRDQLSQQSPTVAAALTQSKVDSTGTVIAAGVVSADRQNAQVLTAVNATVKNADAPNGEERQFRMKISLTRDQNRWLVTNMEFTP